MLVSNVPIFSNKLFVCFVTEAQGCDCASDFPGLLCNVWRQTHYTDSSAAGSLQELPYRWVHTDATGQHLARALVGESIGLWQKSVYKKHGHARHGTQCVLSQGYALGQCPGQARSEWTGSARTTRQHCGCNGEDGCRASNCGRHTLLFAASTKPPSHDATVPVQN